MFKNILFVILLLFPLNVFAECPSCSKIRIPTTYFAGDIIIRDVELKDTKVMHYPSYRVMVVYKEDFKENYRLFTTEKPESVLIKDKNLVLDCTTMTKIVPMDQVKSLYIVKFDTFGPEEFEYRKNLK